MERANTTSGSGTTRKLMLGQIALLFLAHMTGDFYAVFLGPLLPALRAKMGLSLSMTGVLAATYAIAANFAQPLAGLYSEGKNRRTFVAAGVLCAAIGMSVIGYAGNFIVLCILLLAAGLGVAAFHPCGAALAAAAAGQRRTTAVSLFTAGGNVGVTLAPIVVPLVAATDMRRLVWLALPGIAIAALLSRRLVPDAPPRATRTHGLGLRLKRDLPEVSGICLHVVLRFTALTAYMILLPLFGTLRGQTSVEAGRVLALFVLVGTIGALIGGYLSDRVSRKALILITEIGGGACLVLAPMATGGVFYMLLCIGALLGYAAMPLQIVMAQERLPHTAGAASGVVMGFAYGLSNLLLVPLGWLADGWAAATHSELAGVALELQMGAVFMFLAAILAVFLKTAPRASVTQEA